MTPTAFKFQKLSFTKIVLRLTHIAKATIKIQDIKHDKKRTSSFRTTSIRTGRDQSHSWTLLHLQYLVIAFVSLAKQQRSFVYYIIVMPTQINKQSRTTYAIQVWAYSVYITKYMWALWSTSAASVSLDLLLFYHISLSWIVKRHVFCECEPLFRDLNFFYRGVEKIQPRWL